MPQTQCRHFSNNLKGKVLCGLSASWVPDSECDACKFVNLDPVEHTHQVETLSDIPRVTHQPNQIGDCLKDAFAADGWVMTASCSCEELRQRINWMGVDQIEECIVELSKEILPNVKHAEGVQGLMARVGAAFLPGLALKIIQGYLRECVKNFRRISPP